jgi:hypothetical protein
VLTDLFSAGRTTKVMTMKKLIGVLVVVLFASGTALAQPKAPAKAPAGGGDKAGGGKVKVYDFSGDTIEGDLVKPEGSTVDARDFAKHSSLITIRKDFIKEIVKSAQDL